MNVNIELLKTFHVVAKYGNISKASEELLVSQSAVSKTIKNIESQLDCKLFIRSKKGVKLTREGEILYKSTSKIINILNNDLKNIVKSKTINILVGKVLTENILVPYLNIFRNKYPDIHINFSCSDIEGVLDKIKSGDADFAIGYYIDGIDDCYEQRSILKELHPIFVCNNSYSNLINKKVDIKELENYPFIISSKGATTHDYALDIFKKYNLNIIPTMDVLGTSLIVQLVKNGLGISILTEEFIKSELNNHELYKININQNMPTRQLNILTYKNRKFSKEIKYLIDLLIENDI